jgi:hypothetical protein
MGEPVKPVVVAFIEFAQSQPFSTPVDISIVSVAEPVQLCVRFRD